jgi:hypothetical protein
MVADDPDRGLRQQAWRLNLERLAPRWDRRRIVAALVPHHRALVLAVLAMLAMLPGLGIAGAAFRFGKGGPANPNNLASAFLLFGPTSAVPAAFLLAVAGLIAKRPGARTLLFGTASLLLTLGGVGCGVGLTMGEEPIEGGAPIAARAAALGYGPFVFLLGLPALVFAIVTPFRVWKDFVTEQCERMLDVMLARGSVAMADLTLATNATPERVRSLLESLVKEGKLAIHFDDRHQRVFTARRLASRQALLVELVETRARVSIDWLAAELGEPVEIVQAWVGDLRAAGHLSARLQDGWLQFDPDGKGSAITRSCESCGGPMKAVGRGVFHCAYCGSEVFV